jgi:hypothetical protein
VVNPLTIQEYQKLGIAEQYIETAHDAALKTSRDMTQSDTHKKVQITDVYRKQISDEEGVTSEYITWQQHVTGRSAIDNPHTWLELADDTSIYYTPRVEKSVRLNPETEQQEVFVNQILGQDTRYQYPFNKENIAMIKKKVNIRTRFYVQDEADFMRVVPDFNQWSTKSFGELIGSGSASAASGTAGATS